jgi:cation:H+ antiporter
MELLFLAFGIAGLWIGTELTIGSALRIAKQHSLSEFFVGLAILSIGSDLPELAIAIDSGIKNSLGGNVSGIVVGTAIGSIAGQMGFVLGVTGLIGCVLLPPRYIFRHGAVMLGAFIVLFLTAFDGVVNRVEGITLITLYLVYVFSLLRGERARDERTELHAQPPANPWLVVALGLCVIIGASELTIQSVIILASRIQISEAFISVVIIGLGSSLPELSISVSAILKKQIRLSVGNIIGSSILDILLPVGIAAIISPVFFDREFRLFDLPYIFMLSLITLFFFARERGLQKKEAGCILGLYFLYLLIKYLQQ